MMHSQPPVPKLEDCINDICPWSGQPVKEDGLTRYRDRSGKSVVVGFCNSDCRDRFDAAITVFDVCLEKEA